MPTFTLTNRYTGAVLHSGEGESLLEMIKAGASLSGADLSGADLSRASLSKASLSRAKINWSSHDTIAQILRRSAGGDPYRRMFAGLVLISRDWCWQEFLALPDRGSAVTAEVLSWALDTLAPFVRDGDNAPAVLLARVAPAAEAASA